MNINTSEDILLTQLKQLIDQTSEQLQWGNLTLEDAIALIRWTRAQAEKLIPHQMELYRLIYASRFRRLLEQFVMPRQVASQFNWHKPY
jgi:hypothetical protein